MWRTGFTIRRARFVSILRTDPFTKQRSEKNKAKTNRLSEHFIPMRFITSSSRPSSRALRPIRSSEPRHERSGCFGASMIKRVLDLDDVVRIRGG